MSGTYKCILRLLGLLPNPVTSVSAAAGADGAKTSQVAINAIAAATAPNTFAFIRIGSSPLVSTCRSTPLTSAFTGAVTRGGRRGTHSKGMFELISKHFVEMNELFQRSTYVALGSRSMGR
ncbi:hypothetical protein [Actinomadura alba]|uniref:hypothetical protein n=1 Tax=Actinomadura alba TaxID=406431 RepID=UPI001FE87509|nr:hypothetical protein [Actinomadura alba]